MRSPAAGNALFLILIAVALFAALSYAITQSSRGGGGIGREQAELEAAKIIQYAGWMQQVVQRLMLTGGCTVNQISFDTTPGTGGEDNPSAPLDLRCHVFATNGGGERVPSTWGGNPVTPTGGWHVSDKYSLENVGTTDTGAGCPGCELVLLNAVLSDADCAALNARLINNPAIPTNTRNMAGVGFNGTFTGWHNMDSGTVTGAVITGFPAYCTKTTHTHNINVLLFALVTR